MRSDSADVIVIGAGIAGLAAARLLVRAGLDVIVLEARERVGGRLDNHRFANGETTDIGGQWLGPGQSRINALLAEIGASTFPVYHKGNHILWRKGERDYYRGTIPNINPLLLAELGWLMWRFEYLAAQVSPENPMGHPKAQEWDSRTLHSWLQNNCFSETAYEVFATGVAAVFAAEPRDISLLHALFYARSGTDWKTLLAVEGGAQQDRVFGGTHSICTALAEELGDRVKMTRPVRNVRWRSRSVEIETEYGHFHGKRAIFTLPPNQLLKLNFVPALPGNRDQLWQKMPAGSCIKCIAQYESPFWRKEGLSGHSIALGRTVRVTFDNSHPDAVTGLLLGFIEGENARHWGARTALERQREVISCFAQYFGADALQPIDYVDRDWAAEPYTRGCYAALKGPGTWSDYGHLGREPIGGIHFAGTETATQWYGYIEGALESAERVFMEIRSQLDV
jgi:monoamine oxidase